MQINSLFLSTLLISTMRIAMWNGLMIGHVLKIDKKMCIRVVNVQLEPYLHGSAWGGMLISSYECWKIYYNSNDITLSEIKQKIITKIKADPITQNIVRYLFEAIIWK